MKHLKTLGLAAVAAMALTAFAVSSASATTLEIGGVTKNEAVTITMSLDPGTSVVISRTDGTLANTCSRSHTHGITSVFTGTNVTGAYTEHGGPNPSAGLTFEECERPVTVHDPGTFYIDHEAGTTNGDMFSENLEMTVSTPFGTVNCKTGAGTTIGTITGLASGHATLHLKAVTNCGILLPSASWKGSYTITSPTGLGVSA